MFKVRWNALNGWRVVYEGGDGWHAWRLAAYHASVGRPVEVALNFPAFVPFPGVAKARLGAAYEGYMYNSAGRRVKIIVPENEP